MRKVSRRAGNVLGNAADRKQVSDTFRSIWKEMEEKDG